MAIVFATCVIFGLVQLVQLLLVVRYAGRARWLETVVRSQHVDIERLIRAQVAAASQPIHPVASLPGGPWRPSQPLRGYSAYPWGQWRQEGA